MSNQTLELNDAIYKYLLEHSLRETAVLKALRKETMSLEMARMQIAPEQGQFMALLVSMLGAKNIIEVGVFTGYSTLCMAQALPEGGRIVACDISEDWSNIASKYWQAAAVADKIDLRLAPAQETLAAMIAKGEQGQYDFAFIDADKGNYTTYYEQCLELLRPGGV
ncbi:MAG TPA: class I SAM-dependent methyltransferase, partial [Pseudomonadales bacterium]